MIERLYVHNYRCLENFTLDLSDQPSALLIGKNGSGKSTVLAALKVLQKIARGPNRVKESIKKDDFPGLKTDLPIRIEVDMRLEDKPFAYSVAFDWPTEFREARIMEESLLAGNTSVFKRKLGEVELPDGTKFGLDWHVFGLPAIGEKPSARLIPVVKAFLAEMILVQPIPRLMEGFSWGPASELEFDALNYAACLRGLLDRKPGAYGHFQSFVKDVMPDFTAIENKERGKEGSQLTVTFEHPDTKKPLVLDFDNLSDGEKCFLLAGYIVAANTANRGVFCAWDEPDNHLSISEVRHLVTALRKMSNLGGQFIATSHHPETLRTFSDDNTFVLTRKSHLEPTVAKLLNQYEYKGDLINALLRNEIIE